MLIAILVFLAVIYFAVNIAGIVYETSPACRQHDIARQERLDALALASKNQN